MADGYLNFDTKINESGFNEGINKLGSLGKSGLSVVSCRSWSSGDCKVFPWCSCQYGAAGRWCRDTI